VIFKIKMVKIERFPLSEIRRIEVHKGLAI
jgi:hypothetical protein